MLTAEPLIPEPGYFKADITIGKLKIFKSLGIDQITPELIEAGGNTLYS
jgi:hypothetical protein